MLLCFSIQQAAQLKLFLFFVLTFCKSLFHTCCKTFLGQEIAIFKHNVEYKHIIEKV